VNSRIAVYLFAVFLSHAVLAEGGTHTQGTYLCGEYLDAREADGGIAEKADCVSQTQGMIDDDPKGWAFKVWEPSSGQQVDVTVACPGKSKDKFSRDCKVTSGPQLVCGNKKDVVVVQGYPDGGAISPDNNKLLLACASDKTLDGTPSARRMGAVGRCLKWFDFTVQQGNLDPLNACIRAARADYCACGESKTHVGTWIQIGSGNEEWDCSELEGACLEAGWSPGGPTCLDRPRTLSLKAYYEPRAKKIQALDIRKQSFVDKGVLKLFQRLEKLSKAQDGEYVAKPGQPLSRLCPPDLTTETGALFFNRSRINALDSNQPEKDCQDQKIQCAPSIMQLSGSKSKAR
jgi:hypothetical protein